MTGFGNTFGGSMDGQMSASLNSGTAPNAVKDTTTASFPVDVLEASKKQPVLVDFWAPWCGPCKQLAPALEKVVAESQGRVKLVKMNIDEHPSVAGQLGIQSIPAVIAFVDGRPVDGFMGAVPETQIRTFIDKVAGSGNNDAAEIEAVLGEAEAALGAGDISGAAELFGAILQADPGNLKALAGMANCMLSAGQWEHARDLIANLKDEQKKDPALVALAARIVQIEEARKLGNPSALEHELSLNPDHHDARIKLAKIRNVEGNRAEAVEHLFYIMKKDRAFDDDGARRLLVQFFEAWGPMDPNTIAARRKLSSILFS